MKMMNIDMDPSVIRQFVDQLKNADDDTLNKFKEQYSKGKVNMNSFSKYSKSEEKVKEAIFDLFKIENDILYIMIYKKTKKIDFLKRF